MIEIPFSATLTEALQHTAKGDKSITYIRAKNDELTVHYSELYRRARQWLYQLNEAGVNQGDELILLASNNEQFVDIFWAAILGGIVVVPLSSAQQNSAQKRILSVFQKLSNPFIWIAPKPLDALLDYADEQQLTSLKPQLKQRAILAGQWEPDKHQAEVVIVAPEGIAFIQFSSGSTGEPKGVVLTHHNLMTNIRSILKDSAATEQDISLSWMPLTHDMGIIGFHLAPLVLNTDVYLMPPELFVRRPQLWLDKLSEKKATVTASPNFGYQHILKYFKPENQGGLDLSALRLIFNGAEQISAALCREFNQTLQPFGLKEAAIFPVYGLAEASLAAAFTRPADTVQSIFIDRQYMQLGESIELSSEKKENSLELVLLGEAVSEAGLMVADLQGKYLPELILGHVFIQGDNVTQKFYDEPELTSALINQGGWLETGDIGFIYQKQLVLTGRFKDIIIVNGQNYHAHDLEQLCESLPEIGEYKTAACTIPGKSGDALAIFVTFKGELSEFIAISHAIRAILAKESGIEVAEVIPVSAFPKTTSGKIQRFQLSSQFMADTYKNIVTELNALSVSEKGEDRSESHSIEQQLMRICKDVIPDRQILPEDDLFEIGISSLSLTQIHERLDALYPEQVDLTDLFDYPSIRTLASFLAQNAPS